MRWSRRSARSPPAPLRETINLSPTVRAYGPPTPVWAAHNIQLVAICVDRRLDDLAIDPDHLPGHHRRYTKVSELDASVLVREDVGAFDVSVDDTLRVQVDEPLEDLLANVSFDPEYAESACLRDVHCDQVFRDLAILLEDLLQRAVLAVSAGAK